MTGRVVVGVDGSPPARKALQWAAEEARLRGSQLEAVWAWSALDQPGGYDPSFGEREVADLLEKAIADCDMSSTDVIRSTPCDLPAHALIDASRGAAMLVVGSRGAGGFASLVLGSVSQQVAMHATCPVVVIR